MKNSIMHNRDIVRRNLYIVQKRNPALISFNSVWLEEEPKTVTERLEWINDNVEDGRWNRVWDAIDQRTLYTFISDADAILFKLRFG